MQALERRVAEGQNPLALEIENRIRKDGPMPFNEYMGICNYGVDSVPGFYSGGKAVIGDNDGQMRASEVDYVTSPEMSPLFGFMIARQVLEMRILMGNPVDFTVVEMGAGNGTLAYDILRALEYFDPTAAPSIKYKIVEKSAALIERQRDRLKDFPVEFIEQSATEPLEEPITGLILSNELGDTFPVHIIRKTSDGFEELYIDKGEGDKFSEVWLPPQQKALDYLQRHNVSISEGDLFPVCLEAEEWMKSAASSLEQGYILTFDYDYLDPKQPFRVFAAPSKGVTQDETIAYRTKNNAGEVDLTSEVYFQALADIGKLNGLEVVGDVTQGGFLQGLAFHFFRDKLALDYGKLPPRIKGDRKYLMQRADKLLSNYRVLIQSKGIETRISLMGAKNTYHDHTEVKDRVFMPLH